MIKLPMMMRLGKRHFSALNLLDTELDKALQKGKLRCGGARIPAHSVLSRSRLTRCPCAYAPCRFSRDRPRFSDNLDVIKFLCKDLWTILFKKQVDNLKTNHRVCTSTLPYRHKFIVARQTLPRERRGPTDKLLQGVYVLTDNSFRPFARMSMSVRSEAVSMAQAVWDHQLLDPFIGS